MAVLDLKPLTPETIAELGLNAHELWLVRSGEDINGPFETESLKHFAAEFSEQFDETFATRTDEENWQPFFSHPLFQRRSPQVVKAEGVPGEAPLWLLDQGHKIGPFLRQDIIKRIELGSIGFTHLVSLDDGHSWHKLYQVEGFDRRFLSSSELPFAPVESQFQKARLELLEKIDASTGRVNPTEELAEMAHQSSSAGKVIAFRPEDVPLMTETEAMMSPNLKWQIGAGLAAVLVLVSGIGFMVTRTPSTDIADADVPEETQGETAPGQQRAFVPPPSPSQQPHRAPANHNEGSSYSPTYNPPRYTTHLEAHQNDYNPENEPHPEPEENREPAADPSLINPPPEEPQSLDAAMNGNPPPVEESGDF